MRNDDQKGIVRARWEIQRPDGNTIRGDLRALRGPPPRSAVVLCHGFKGFREWAFFPSLARAIAMRGHAAVTFDFSRSGIGADGVDFSALELFAGQTHSENVREIHTVLGALANGPLFPARPARVALFGFSRGGGEAVLAAAEGAEIDALVTWSAIGRVRRASPEHIRAWENGETVRITNSRTKQEMPVGPEYWRDVVENATSLDIEAAAARITVPWLIAHGDRDETVSVEDAHALFDAAGENAELLIVEGGSHTYGAAHPFTQVPPPLGTVAAATLDWLDEVLHGGDEHAAAAL